MNILAYILYACISWLITVHVGLRFYKNGKHYILVLLQGDEQLTDSINRMLLTGYYLVNLGYIAISIQQWKTIDTVTALLTSVCTMTGKIMIILAVMHYINMGVLLFYSHWHNNLSHNKNAEL